jgi:hypothetical protein
MSIQSQYVLFVDRQPTSEISDNQLVQFYRMVGTVNHSIGCCEAIEMLTHCKTIIAKVTVMADLSSSNFNE